jgi:hypothetical protein
MSSDRLAKLRVLLVDDHLDNLDMYALYLRSQGFEDPRHATAWRP